MKNRKTTVCTHCGLPCRILQRHLNRHHPYQSSNNFSKQHQELPQPSLPPPRLELPPTVPPQPCPATPTATPLRAISLPKLPSSPLSNPAIRTVCRLHERASHQRLVTVERKGSVRSSLQQEVWTFAEHVPDAEPRHLCDCSRCIRHAVDLSQLSLPVEGNGIPLVEFTRLPGMNLARAPDSDIRALAKSFNNIPDQHVVACGCGPCTAHRNLIQACLQAQDFEDTPPRSGKLLRPRQK